MPAPLCDCPWSCIEVTDRKYGALLRCTGCGEFVPAPRTLPVLVAMIREVGMMADDGYSDMRKRLRLSEKRADHRHSEMLGRVARLGTLSACGRCGGKGYIVKPGRIRPNAAVNQQTCPQCGGTGQAASRQ